MSLKIASINVNGLRNNKKRALVFNWIVSQNIDLVCLQETHCTHDETGLWNREWKENGGGESFWNCGTNDSRGVGILLRKDFTHCFDVSMIDNNGRIQIGEIKINTAVYHIINLYTPNNGSDRKHFFENVKNLNDLYADDSTDHYNVFLGDFNCALDRRLDRAPSHQNEDTGLKELKSLLLKFDLDDIWRSKFPKNRRQPDIEVCNDKKCNLLKSAFTEDKHLYSQKSSCWLQSLYKLKKLLYFDSLQVSYTAFEDSLKTFYKCKISNQLQHIKSNNTVKLRYYSRICSSFDLKAYLSFDIPKYERSLLTKIRISAHSFAIETGRYSKPKTLVTERFCKYCGDQVKDEDHFLLYCPLHTKTFEKGLIFSKI
ncbi:E3.1.11.2 [Mytilus coruscus]|uniref:exodeoxyribonuclease III n=1 Tax=Mytilus coruscus TaxID=42192 RepID=A0A6J8DXH7_MYTCO|nr:E3.1.11.2 [Mytilus coruscus]